MSIDVIDGTIEAVTLQRVDGKSVLYKSITIRMGDGSERLLAKVAAAPAVAEMLQPGVAGRFYGYRAIDHRGLFGARTVDGRSNFVVPSGNERIMLMMALVGPAAFLITLFTRSAIMVLALLLSILGAVGFVRYRKTRIEAKALYDADANRVPSGAQVVAGA